LAATVENRCADAGHDPDRCVVQLVGGRCVHRHNRATSSSDDNDNDHTTGDDHHKHDHHDSGTNHNRRTNRGRTDQ
jgi:hypothetical protein